MSVIEILAGPIIGGVIGYFTNYIAVKMLFRPLKPVKIGGRTLPFTPGIIPKGKPRLAKALGKAVGEKLLTREDIRKMLLSGEVKDKILDGVVKGIQEVQHSQDSLETFLEQYMTVEDYEAMRGHLEDFITEKISHGLEQLDVGKIIAEEGAKEIREKFQGTMVSMFLKDDLIKSVAEPIGDKVGEYIRENGKDLYPPGGGKSRRTGRELPYRPYRRGKGKSDGCAGSGRSASWHNEKRIKCSGKSWSCYRLCDRTAESVVLKRRAVYRN